MHDDIDQLNETFAAHEHLAPNAADVLARANVLARSYRRRRRAAQATGASVLSAGIVAGSVAIPGLKWHQGSTSGVSTAAGSAGSLSSGSSFGSATPIPSKSPTYSQDQALTEYFADGYDYNNAAALASLWHETDTNAVKVKAGLLLLQGNKLPVSPNNPPESAAQKTQNEDIDAFFAAGYTYDDALSLGSLWNETDVLQIKTEAGQKLLAGETLPIQPSPVSSVSAGVPGGAPASAPASAPADNPAADGALTAYFAAGYTYDDAVSLGKLWNETDTYQIKIEAGQKLLAGQTLPIAP